MGTLCLGRSVTDLKDSIDVISDNSPTDRKPSPPPASPPPASPIVAQLLHFYDVSTLLDWMEVEELKYIPLHVLLWKAAQEKASGERSRRRSPSASTESRLSLAVASSFMEHDVQQVSE